MRLTALLLLLLPLGSFASVVKKVVIENQEYSCRPSNIKTRCAVETDLGFIMSLAADSADASVCLTNTSTKEEIKSCFLQRRMKAYAQDLDAQMVSQDCWNKVVAKCTEIHACPNDPKKKCGYLGTYLQTLEDLGLETSFRNEADKICRFLIP